jgi:hypothetical protein
MSNARSIWVFNGVRSTFPSGVFTSRGLAESWIHENALTGTLTEYPLDISMYDYAISQGLFSPKTEEHTTAFFIGKFTGGGIIHFYYEDGILGVS